MSDNRWPADNSLNILQDLSQRGGIATHMHNEFAINPHLPGTWGDPYDDEIIFRLNSPKIARNDTPAEAPKK